MDLEILHHHVSEKRYADAIWAQYRMDGNAIDSVITIDRSRT